MTTPLSTENHADLYGAIIDRFTAWATAQAGVEAAIIIGSRARTDHPADPWSDLDILTFADDPGIILQDTSWLEVLGEPAITFVHPTPLGGWAERRVLLRNGCDVDVPVVPASLIDRLLAPEAGDPLREMLGGVIGRGYRILLDRDGRLADALNGLTAPKPEPLTQAMLDETVSDFWYHCVWTTKKLRRGEIYTAHDCLDGYLRHLMMRLVRWTAEAGGEAWHSMRFLEEWAPREVVALLPQTWAEHSHDDIARAVGVMMDTVSLLSERLAQERGFSITDGEEKSARAIMRGIAGR